MLTGDIRNQVDAIWNDCWSGGISNPMEVMEQLTYLLFIKRLDDIQTTRELQANRTRKPIESPIYPSGTFKRDENDRTGVPYESLRWSKFRTLEPRAMHQLVENYVFPHLRTLGGENSDYAAHMQNARFTMPVALLTKVVDKLDRIPMENRDTKGDVYEYMLSKIASAGENGQFRTPRHIINLMVALVAPKPGEAIVDPASGTCGFLVGAGEYIRKHHPLQKMSDSERRAFHNSMFHGYDFDATMLRIGSMNMMLHGVENPNIRNRDSLAQDHAEDAESYDIVLANPPFAGSLDHENTAKDLQAIVKTRKTELLFLALFLRLLKTGGRAAVIVPDGVLFGSSKAHKALRRMLVEEHQLQAIISMPSGVFRPYAGVSTAILLFTKTGIGGTGDVWFYKMEADGYSLDDKRNPLLPEEKLGPAAALGADEQAKNNLPDVLARWGDKKAEAKRPRTAQSFLVPKAEIAAKDYDLSLNRYREVEHVAVETDPPKVILARLQALEKEIAAGLKELEGMLG